MLSKKMLFATLLILSVVFVMAPLARAAPSANSASRDANADLKGSDDQPRATFTGTVSRGYDSTRHSFTVPSGTTKITAKLNMPSGADFDLSMFDSSSRRTGGWTQTDHSVKTNIPNSVYSGISKNPEWVNVTNPTTTGTWKVGCYAYSGSGTYTITVTLTSGGSDTTPPTITITSPADNAQLTSPSVTVTWTGSDSGSGINYYETRIDSSSWINKGTATSHTYSGVANGGHTVEVRAWDNAGNSAIDSVTFTVNAASAALKFAVIVGISDYKAISDLSYCDEDATDWYNFLWGTMGFNTIWVYGDGHTANYPKYDGIANEYNVKAALRNMIVNADSDDTIAFISSGHGSGNGVGSSYLCMWDSGSGESGENGNLYDTELASILSTSVASKIFVFLDHCYSGGFGPDLMAMANKAHVYLSTTCTQNGYGYDDSSHQNGAWTYYFLQYTWIGHFASAPHIAMEDIYTYAKTYYPYGGGDAPQQYDGDTANKFYLG
jgi:hypothetical protein